jgi:hypothetical protein
MSRTPATFKQSDVMRAVKAVRAMGLEVIETKIERDGSIVLVHKTEDRSAAAPTPYDEWKASNGSR